MCVLEILHIYVIFYVTLSEQKIKLIATSTDLTKHWDIKDIFKYISLKDKQTWRCWLSIYFVSFIFSIFTCSFIVVCILIIFVSYEFKKSFLWSTFVVSVLIDFLIEINAEIRFNINTLCE